jgi:hypothetical protein
VQKIIENGLDDPGSPGKFEAIRMPNKVNKQSKEVGGSTIHTAYQEIQSPTTFLGGKQGQGLALDNFCINDEKNSQQIEGEMIRKATETKLKKYWY